MGEQRVSRLGKILVGRTGVAGSGETNLSVVSRALAAEGFVVETAGGAGGGGAEGVVGLWLFPVGAEIGAGQAAYVHRLRRRCDAVALVAVGIEDCPTWPDRAMTASRVLDPDGRLPVFAVALGLADRGDAVASGFDDLVGWIIAESDGRAAVELARRTTAERLTGLRLGSAAVRTWAGGRIHAGFRELASAGQEAAMELRVGDVERFVHWLRCSSADLERDLVGAVGEQAAHIQATALVGLAAYDRAADPRPAGPAPSMAVSWQRRTWGAEDAVLVLIGASSGLGVGRLAAGSMAGLIPGGAAVLAALLIGLGVATAAVALRRRVLLRGQARAWVAEVLADARARTEWRVAAMLTGVEAAAAAAVRRAAWRGHLGSQGTDCRAAASN